MIEDRMAFLAELRKANEAGEDFLREGVRQFVGEVMAAEVTARVGRRPHSGSTTLADEFGIV